MITRRRLTLMLAMVVVAAMATVTGPAAAASTTPAPRSPAAQAPQAVLAAQTGTLIAHVRSTRYPVLYWNRCRLAGTGEYIFLETISSTCGSGWTGQVWGYTFVSFENSDAFNAVGVCQSPDHSGTTTLYDNDRNGSQSLSATGGRCASTIRYGVASYRAGWGGEQSPAYLIGH